MFWLDFETFCPSHGNNTSTCTWVNLHCTSVPKLYQFTQAWDQHCFYTPVGLQTIEIPWLHKWDLTTISKGWRGRLLYSGSTLSEIKPASYIINQEHTYHGISFDKAWTRNCDFVSTIPWPGQRGYIIHLQDVVNWLYAVWSKKHMLMIRNLETSQVLRNTNIAWCKILFKPTFW